MLLQCLHLCGTENTVALYSTLRPLKVFLQFVHLKVIVPLIILICFIKLILFSNTSARLPLSIHYKMYQMEHLSGILFLKRENYTRCIVFICNFYYLFLFIAVYLKPK